MSADARFLTAMADELARARRTAESLAPLLSAGARPDAPDAMVRAQGLDLLVQHLDALSEMTRRVAEGERPRDAAAAAPLGALAQRMDAALTGRTISSPPHPPPSGDLVLFD